MQQRVSFGAVGRLDGLRRSVGGRKRLPITGWIDSDLLEEEYEDSVCALCFGIMVKPARRCLEGHTFCRGVSIFPLSLPSSALSPQSTPLSGH